MQTQVCLSRSSATCEESSVSTSREVPLNRAGCVIPFKRDEERGGGYRYIRRLQVLVHVHRYGGPISRHTPLLPRFMGSSLLLLLEGGREIDFVVSPFVGLETLLNSFWVTTFCVVPSPSLSLLTLVSPTCSIEPDDLNRTPQSYHQRSATRRESVEPG
jgi:hypothetical protein